MRGLFNKDFLRDGRHIKREFRTHQYQHNLTPRIYVLHKSKVAAKLSNRVKFMSYINWKFREEVHEEERSNWHPGSWW